jgi:hypothetical protein
VCTRTPLGSGAGFESSRLRSAKAAAGRSPLDAAKSCPGNLNAHAKRVLNEYG